MRETFWAVLLLGLSAFPAAGASDCRPLTAERPQPGDQLGCSVFLRNDLAVLGANLDDSAAIDGGAITPFHKAGGSWLPEPEITAPDARRGDQFGFSASVDGDWLAVGAPFADSDRAASTGAVYLFHRQNGHWDRGPKLTASDAARGDRFGLALALSGDTLLVGAPFDSDTGSLSGSVYVFRLEGGTWSQRQKLAASDGRPFDNFGFSVSLDGGTAIVGAPFHDRGNTAGNSGAAYIFELGGTVWSQRARLELGDGKADDQFGSAVAVRGEFLAVGARGDDAGSVHVFHRNGAGWQEELPKLTAKDGAKGDLFGVAVSLSENRLLVGASRHNETGTRSGVAYLFERQTTDGAPRWEQVDKFIGPTTTAEDQLGQSVSISGDDLVVGAYLDDVGASRDAGSAAACKVEPQPSEVDLATRIKDDGETTVVQGQALTYTIIFENLGKADVTGARIVDRFPSALTGAGGLPATLDLKAGEAKTFHVSARVRQNACGQFTNEACIIAPGDTDSNPGNDCFSDTDQVRGVHLAVDKTDDPDPVAMGGILTYTLRVTNQGTATATGVVLDDATPTGLVAIGRDCAGFSCALGTLGPGQSVPFTLKFQVPVCYAGPNPIVNIATVKADQPDCFGDDTDTDTETTTVIDRKVANLAIEKSGPSCVDPGNRISYTLKVTNLGPDCACEVTLSDPVPAALGSPTIPAGCTLTPANEIRCAIGTLCAAESRTLPLGFNVSPAAAAGSKIVNQATVTAGGTADPDASNNAAMAMTTVGCCGLSITKTDGLDAAMPGQTLFYTITVSNSGTNLPAATVTDHFPAALTKVRWCRDIGEFPCTPNQAGDLQDTIPLPAGGSATYRVQGSVALNFTGTLANTASVSAPGCAGAAATDTTEIGFTGVKAFCTSIEGNFTPGGMITYTFVLLNGGPAAQADNPGDEFTDTLPATLTLTGASADSGTAETAGNMATWNGSIPVGGVVTITVTATIDPLTPIGTTICNQAAIAFDADGDGTNESNGLSDDPGQPGSADPCCFLVLSPTEIPALSPAGLAALALLLAGLAVLRLRIRGRRS